MKQTKFKKVPFNLELAKKITNKEVNGRIVNGMGSEVRIIYFNKMGIYPIVGLIRVADGEEVYTFSENGRQDIKLDESPLDLHLEVPTYHKDYSNFKPYKWQPCLVRDNKKDLWEISVCAGRNSAGKATFYHRGCTCSHEHCLPLSKVTERLADTRKSYEELIQELDAELTATNQEPDAEQDSIIQDVEFEDDKQFDFHEIKTFKDACEKLGMKEHLLTGSMGGDREAQGQAQALYKLLIIQKAMNNGKCCNKNGYSYYPHWNFYTETLIKYETEKSKKEKGIKKIFPYDYMLDKEYSYVRCSPISHRTPFAETSNGFPLCFNSKEAALYAAKQFEDLFFQYYGIKVKE